jgi:hypothetical protein
MGEALGKEPMTTASHDDDSLIAELVRHIRREGGQLVRLMNDSGQHESETVIVLHEGTKPSIRNLFRRSKTEAYRIGNNGMVLLDKQTGQPYIQSWPGTVMSYYVLADLEGTEHRHLQNLLKRIRRRIQECH